MRKKRYLGIIILLLLVFSITIGYSYLSATLNISGSSQINEVSWDVHFDYVDVLDNSVALSNGDVAATINPSNDTEINYTITLNKPGDCYEFLVDVVNDGTIDAMIGSVQYMLNGNPITDGSLPPYLEYYVKYEDGTLIKENQELLSGETEILDVYVGFKADVAEADLPTEDQTISLRFNVNYVQANDDAIEVRVRPVSFEDDDWSTIAGAASTGNTAAYSLGDMKEIDMGEFGVHYVRIANMDSEGAGCGTSGFSQSGCGFVLEFTDAVTNHAFNSSATTNGGWSGSELRTYINSEVYNALPSDLKEVILATNVVSRNADGSYATTSDKLYLLDETEIYADPANAYSKQLEYYEQSSVTTTTNYGLAIKKFNGVSTGWYLRSPAASSATDFVQVSTSGAKGNVVADSAIGIAPAFRLA